MTYEIIGIQEKAFVSKKNGKQYLPVYIRYKDPFTVGFKSESVLISEEVLRVADFDNKDDSIFEEDGESYYCDIDYNNRGFIQHIRFWNSHTSR